MPDILAIPLNFKSVKSTEKDLRACNPPNLDRFERLNLVY